MSNVTDLTQLFLNKIAQVNNLNELEQLRVEFIGKKGCISELMQGVGKIPAESRKTYAEAINTLKDDIQSRLITVKNKLEDQELEFRLKSEDIDVTLESRPFERGKIHPITQVIADLKNIFSRLGFEHIDGPEIVNDWDNFTALNTPPHHPARQMHDTFYINNSDLLLRTQTSSVQIRHMTKHKPPIKIISIGKTYRSDFDATHTPMFHQIEGLYIDKHITIANLKSCLETFLRLFFNVQDIPIRLRPSYFPFTEPSIEVDVQCDRTQKNEIKIGNGSDWLEILGCGMVHPQVLRNVNIDPDEYQGFAFGCGVERLAMLKYNIPDVRPFFESDSRWIKHYGF